MAEEITQPEATQPTVESAPVESTAAEASVAETNTSEPVAAQESKEEPEKAEETETAQAAEPVEKNEAAEKESNETTTHKNTHRHSHKQQRDRNNVKSDPSILPETDDPSQIRAQVSTYTFYLRTLAPWLIPLCRSNTTFLTTTWGVMSSSGMPLVAPRTSLST